MRPVGAEVVGKPYYNDAFRLVTDLIMFDDRLRCRATEGRNSTTGTGWVWAGGYTLPVPALLEELGES